MTVQTETKRRCAEVPRAPNRGNRLTQRVDSERAQSAEATTPDLAELLRLALWNSLPFAERSGSGFYDFEEVAECGGKSVVLLSEARQEAANFLQTVCQANLEFHAAETVNETARDEVLAAQLQAMRAHVEFPAWLPGRVNRCDRASVPLARATKLVQDKLLALTSEVVAEVTGALQRLAAEKIVGQIDWKTPTACKLSFHRRLVEQQSATTTVVSGPRTIRDQGPIRQAITSQTELKRAEHEVYEVVHEHELIETVSDSIEATAVPIPERFRAAIQAIPHFLRPLMHLVSGIQIHGRVTKKLLRTQTWQGSRELAPLVEHLPSPEPALVLGSYVLCGWGAAEAIVENQRQEQVLRQLQTDKQLAEARSARWQWAALFVAFQATMVLWRDAVVGWPWTIIAVLLVLASLGAVFGFWWNHSLVLTKERTDM